MKLPISVFIIARDEADRIPDAISAVRDWVDEVHVIDSGSTDGTVSVSAALGATTHFRAWTGYGEQKVYGEGLCRNDWLLNVDADEAVSPELAREIQALFVHGSPGRDAYRLPILPRYPFQTHGHPWTAFHRPIRLYRKSMAGFDASPVHDTVRVRPNPPSAKLTARVGTLKGMVIHRSFRSLTHHLDKVNRYSSAQAEDRYDKGRDPSVLTLVLTPPLAFLKSFLLRREFANGVDGVIVSYMYAFQRFIRLAKTRERFRLAAQARNQERNQARKRTA